MLPLEMQGNLVMIPYNWLLNASINLLKQLFIYAGQRQEVEDICWR